MPTPGRNTYLSKSLFMRGLQCHKSIYLHKHQPEMRGESTPKLLALLRNGKEVGVFARHLFPGGVEILFDGLSKEEQRKLRKALLGYCRQDTLGMVRLLERMRSME